MKVSASVVLMFVFSPHRSKSLVRVLNARCRLLEEVGVATSYKLIVRAEAHQKGAHLLADAVNCCFRVRKVLQPLPHYCVYHEVEDGGRQWPTLGHALSSLKLVSVAAARATYQLCPLPESGN